MQKLNSALRRLPVWAIWLLGLIPLALLIFDAFNARLGVDPIISIEHRLGRTGFYLLIAGLAVTPLLRFGRINLMRYRRALGLLAFLYIILHLLAWALLDMGLIWSQMISDIVKRPYLTFGMASLLALLPLAITSNDYSIRKLGGQAWRNFHRLTYLAVPLAGLHYLWVGKVIEQAPLLWLCLIFGLLALRLIPRKKRKAPRFREGP